MREIEFRAWHQEAKEMFYPETQSSVFRWKEDGQPIIIEQYTGLTDKNGVKIFEGDLVNIFFTSNNGEHIHDCIYKASFGRLGDVQFEFVNILWVDFGHNQYPLSKTLCSRYDSLDYEYDENKPKLKVPDQWGENHFHGTKWKKEDKSFFFELAGNIHQNPKLLEK